MPTSVAIKTSRGKPTFTRTKATLGAAPKQLPGAYLTPCRKTIFVAPVGNGAIARRPLHAESIRPNRLQFHFDETDTSRKMKRGPHLRS